MTERPSFDVMEAMLLDEHHRLRPEAKRMMIESFRCQRERHLQGAIFRTAYGPFLLWRSERATTSLWQRDWLDAVPGAVMMTCHCGVARLVDVEPYRRTMR